MPTISFKTAPAEFAAIAQAARALGLSPGQFARFASLNFVQISQIAAEIDAAKSEIIESHKIDIKKAVDYLASLR
ncbi:MAG TPA: hypothetical protein PLB67_17270 [Candidatus Hydrogenedentes bacterium]|nr:hypothetical protein [Candidatus Hydrogenedentota bacterium]